MTAPDVPPGSGHYIQNATSPQAATNFNISGTGTANILSAGTQFNLGSNRILSNSGDFNLFAGVGAGSVNTTGISNAFFSFNAGMSNTTASANSFFGYEAGSQTNQGGGNSFFGFFVGRENTTGVGNSFFGSHTGRSNTTGYENVFVGASAGTFNLAGNFNTFVGKDAGIFNTTGSQNAFFGQAAGFFNTSASQNAFFGSNSGDGNTTGQNNTFSGYFAGTNNKTGSSNTILGAFANVASDNLFFAAAIGSGALVNTSNTVVLGRSVDTVEVPGALNVAGTFGANILSATQFNVSGNGVIGGNLGIGITAPLRSFQIGGDTNALFTFDASDASPNAGFIRFGDNTGWKLHIGRNRESSGGGLNNGTAGVLMTVRDNGNVGIGTTAPEAPLHIVQNRGNIRIGNPGCGLDLILIGFIGSWNCQSYSFMSGDGHTYINRFTGRAVIFREGNGPNQVEIRPGGTVGIATLDTGGSTQLCRNSIAAISTCSSSLRYKRDIQLFARGLDLIQRLRPITFVWKQDAKRDVGLAAEEVGAVEPLLTFRNEQGEIEGVKYANMSVVFINAIKEQQQEIAAQEERLRQQQQQIDELRKLLCRSHPNADVCRQEK